MPLKLPTANFATWKDASAAYYYPANCDDNNHIHVNGSKWGSEIEVKSVSIQGVKRRDPALPGRTAAAAVRSDAVQRKEALRRPVWKQPAAASNSAGLGLHR